MPGLVTTAALLSMASALATSLGLPKQGCLEMYYMHMKNKDRIPKGRELTLPNPLARWKIAQGQC